MKKLAAKLKLPVWSIQSIAVKRIESDKIILGATVADFLALIANAEVVVTDSFHGTIFSIMYNKNFFTFMRFSDSQKSSMNSRVKNILSIVGLSNRLFENSITPEAALAYQVDWSDVNKRLNDFRKSSREYFERAIICLKGTQE